MLQAKQILQGRYQLKESLSENAGRQTWLVEDFGDLEENNIGTSVIIKLLAFSPQMQWEDLKLFEREATVLKALTHPKIPKYRDYFCLDKQIGNGLCWFGLVQDYIPGASLQQVLDRGDRFTETQIRSIATQVLEILIYLHNLNPAVLHRDIKPSNLILGIDEQVYLVDFGAVQDPTVVEGATFTVVGTAGYAPLEQFWGKAVPASDLYALGATLIHLLTGIAPINLPQSNLKIKFRDRVSLDSSLVNWIESLTEPDLDLRFASASLALEALKTGRYLSSARLTPLPSASRIRYKNSGDRLSIIIPKNRILFKDVFEFGKTLFLAVSSITFLLFPNLIALAMCFLFFFRSLVIDTGLFLAFLVFMIIFITSWIKSGKEVIKVFSELNSTLLDAFGSQHLHFNKDSFLLEKRFLLFKHRFSGTIPDIKLLKQIAFQTIVIETKTFKYYVDQSLTELESDWLFQVIQDWLEKTK